jgi:hypothetical protein
MQTPKEKRGGGRTLPGLRPKAVERVTPAAELGGKVGLRKREVEHAALAGLTLYT